MKNGLRYARLSAFAAAALVGTRALRAANLFWDPAQSTTGPTDGSGNWDTATPNWYNPATSSLATFNSSTPDSATFGTSNVGSAGNVNPFGVALTQNITVQNITFNTSSTGASYQIIDQGDGGQTLTLAGNVTKAAGFGNPQFALFNSIVLTAGNHTFAINDTSGDANPELLINNQNGDFGLTGAGSVTLDNGAYSQFGTLTFGTDNNYTGGTNILKGRLTLLTGGGLGSNLATIGAQGNLAFGSSGLFPAGSINVTTPINITRSVYTGTDFASYPDAISVNNGGGTKTVSFSGPFTVDSTDARVAAFTNTITIASNIAQGPDVTAGVLTLDGDFAGFVNLTGDNTALKGGLAVIGGVEVMVASEANLAGAGSALNLSGGEIHPTGTLLTDGFLNGFGNHKINNGTGPTALGTLNTGLTLDGGVTFNASSLYGVSLGTRGTGTLNFNGVNVLSGGPFFDGGAVNVNGNSSFGSIQVRSAVFNVASGATFTGTNGGVATLIGVSSGNNGTLNLIGGSTSTFAGPLHIGGTAGSTGVLTVGGGAILTINNGGGGALDFGDGSTGSGTFNGGTVAVAGETWIGNGTGGTGTVQYNAGTLTANNWFVVGRTGANGTLNQSGGTIVKQGGGNAIINDSGAAVLGVYNLGGTGVFNESSGEFWVGQGGGVGILNVTGAGSLTVNNWLAVGRAGGTGTVNLTSGTITQQAAGHLTIGSGGTGTVNVNGGTLTGLNPYVGEVGSGSGTLTVNAGGAAVLNGTTTFGVGDSVAGTINLNGGTLTAAQFVKGGSTGAQTFNFNGGSLIASAASTSYLSGLTAANVLAGGANINASSFAITIGQNLLGNATSTGGGLVLTGTGTLTLAGSNSYAGRTVVNGGTLVSANAFALPAGTGLTTAATTAVNFNGQYLQPANASSAGLTLSNLVAGGGDLFTFGSSTNGSIDSIAYNTASAVTGTNTINLLLGGGTNLSIGTYNLFTDAAGGLGTGFKFELNGGSPVTSTTFTTGGKAYTLTFSQGDTFDRLNVALAQAVAKLYYTGQAGTDFNTAGNFSTDAGGTTAAAVAPGSITDVVLTATANVNNTTPTVTGTATANSLEFNNAAGVAVGGTGTLNLSAGINTFPAGVAIVVDAGAGNNSIGANLTLLNATSQFNTSSANVTRLTGAIGASASSTTLTYAGNGTGGFVASGANTYAGATVVNGPSLQLGSGSALGNAGNRLVLQAGSVDLFGQQVTQSSLNLSGGRLFGSLGTGTLTLTSTGTTPSVLLNANYPNPQAVGTVTGQLALPAGGAVDKSINAGQPVFTGNVALGGATTITLADSPGDAAPELALTGVVSGGASASLTLNNQATYNGITQQDTSDYGTLTLTNSNTYGGGTNIASGKIVVTASGALGTGPVTIVQRSGGGGGVLAFGDGNYSNTSSPLAVANNLTSVTLANPILFGGQVSGTYGYGIYNDNGNNTLSGLITLTNATQSLFVNGGTLTVSNAIGESFTGAELIKRGGATLNLTGTSSTYTGPTQLLGGVLVVNSLANGGSPSSIGASTAAPANLLLQGGTFQYNGSAPAVSNRGYTLVAATTFNSGSGVTLGGQVLATGGSFTKLGAGPLTYTNATGTNTYETATGYPGYQVNQGVVNFGAVGATASGQVNVFQGEVDAGATGQIGNAEIDFNSGTTQINSYISADRGSTTTGLTGTINVNTDAVVTVQNLSTGYNNGLAGYNANIFTNFNGTSTFNDTGVFRLAENSGSTVTMTVNDAANVNVSSTAAGQLQVGYRGTAIVNQTGGTVTTTGVQLGFDNGGTTTGSGTYNLSGGTLRTSNVYSNGGGTTTVNFNGGTLQANTASPSLVTGLTTANVLAGGAKIDTQAFAATIAQNLASGVVNDGGLTKLGAGGTLTLTGNNTYFGATVVSAGTLATGATGTLGLGNLTVGNASNGAVLTLGNATSIADTATVSFGNGSTINLNAANTGSGSTETVSALFNLTTQTAFNTPGTYTALYLDGQFNDSVFASLNGETLTIVGAPEPASLLLLGSAVAPLLLGRRRQRRRLASA